ncbi:MAG: J domain-containing protein [Anaerolineales bacterium]|nr:J domain-containing protein [Anaerolineales bacterium]
MEYKDYYQVLGVPRTASEKEIKSAFRKLARQHHPDVNPGDKAAEDRFKSINEAYEVLSDSEKRKKYDAFGADWERYQQAGGQPGGFDFSRWQAQPGNGQPWEVRYSSPDDLADLFGEGEPYSDFFSTLFGRQARQRTAGARRGRDYEHPVRISFDEAFRGARRIFQLDERRIEAAIPAGVRTGSRVRLSGQGEPGAGGASGGDLYLVIEVEPDSRFERRGDDLYADVPVDFFRAVLGGETRVTTPDGAVALKLPPRTQAGQTFRLRGKGMPVLGVSGHGDLYARIKIVLPADLTDEEVETLRQLARQRGGDDAAN